MNPYFMSFVSFAVGLLALAGAGYALVGAVAVSWYSPRDGRIVAGVGALMLAIALGMLVVAGKLLP